MFWDSGCVGIPLRTLELTPCPTSQTTYVINYVSLTGMKFSQSAFTIEFDDMEFSNYAISEPVSRELIVICINDPF